jgi:coenzyme F420 biosynthesis associated uncharacterized protein
MPAPVDYALAVRTARRLASPGPQLSLTEAHDVVHALRDVTVRAEHHVRAVTGLVPPGEPGPATVVDRGGWAEGNVEGFRAVLEPLSDKLFAGKAPNKAAAAVTARVAGVQMGSVLAWLSSKVLGQYEVFLPPGAAGEQARPGRLTLVAPNIVETERRLGVDPGDFRLWVALHEVTHRTQFTAVPWLHDHVRGEIDALLTATKLDDPLALLSRVKDGLSQRQSLLELLQTPEQKVVLDRVTAFMSLLEGHAEHVMDGVGPGVVPSVVHIRERFQERRSQRGGPLDRVLRKVLGMDLKALQYAEGKAFVDHCVDKVGMARFNTVWESPETLPTRAEIRDPQAWVARVP